MSVSSRLNEVFQSAPEIPFDDSARLIFFSDCHRGDDSWADEFARNQNLLFFAIEYYFNEGYTYFELGDGDELYENKHFSDIRSAHPHIFRRMHEFYQAGRFHMIYGNHDLERANPKVVDKTLFHYIDDRTSRKEPLFDGIQLHEGLILKHAPTGGKILLVHGYQGDPICDQYWKITRFVDRAIWGPLRMFGLDNPTNPAKNYKKRDALEEEMIAWVKDKKQPAIFGHTHRPWFARPGDPPYFNDGCCIHPRSITGIEINQGEIQLIEWSLIADQKGYLKTSKEILASPRKVAGLFAF
jgi:UDP-2,3-diacylglucosamine pyrophosphatase LpxH